MLTRDQRSKKKTLRCPRGSKYGKQLPPLGLREQREELGLLKLRSLEEGPRGAEVQTSEDGGVAWAGVSGRSPVRLVLQMYAKPARRSSQEELHCWGEEVLPPRGTGIKQEGQERNGNTSLLPSPSLKPPSRASSWLILETSGWPS